MSDRNYRASSVNELLPILAGDIMGAGREIGSRAGRVKEISQVSICLENPLQREVLSQARGASLPAQIAETMWVLAGRNDVEWLSAYLPRAKEFSDDGETWRGGYGPRIRKWAWRWGRTDTFDQLKHVVELLKEDPSTRRAMISLYDPFTDGSVGGKDIPCNNWLHFLSREGELDLHVATRSNDLIWGWSGINQFEWSVLQEIVAHLLGLNVGSLHFSISSLHIYDRHWSRAERISQERYGGAEAYFDLGDNFGEPTFNLLGGNRSVGYLDKLIELWFDIEGEIRRCRTTDDHVMSRINLFPEPMMQDWLRVIAAWWRPTNSLYFLSDADPIIQTAAQISPPRVLEIHATKIASGAITASKIEPPIQFHEYVDKLHREKDAVYGDSWKKRGEVRGIQANIARKIDRLGVGGAGDTAADTVVDLLLYLIKYRLWIAEELGVRSLMFPDHHLSHVNQVSESLKRLRTDSSSLKKKVDDNSILRLVASYDQLENSESKSVRASIVNRMILEAYPLAEHLWSQERSSR